jgi:hypothetical protein
MVKNKGNGEFEGCRRNQWWYISWYYPDIHLECVRKTMKNLRMVDVGFESYFKTGGLQPTSSSWHQAPWDPRLVFFFQLNTCGFSPYATSSLTRGWVCRLQLLLVLASAVILGFESRGTHDHILLSQIRDFPKPAGPGLRIYIPQELGAPLIPPGTGFPFRRLLRLAGLRWRFSQRWLWRIVSSGV